MITITLTKREADGLLNYLLHIIGKGSLSTTPSWAKRVFAKIKEQKEKDDATTNN